MTLKEYYDKLDILIAGNDELDGFCLQLRRGHWSEENYKEIVKLLKEANDKMLSSEAINSEECLRIVDIASQFYGDSILYFIGKGIDSDEYIKVMVDFQNTFGVSFNKERVKKIDLKNQLDSISTLYQDYDSKIRFGRFEKEQFEELYSLFKGVADAVKKGDNDDCLSAILGIYSNFAVDTATLLIANNYEEADEIIRRLENLF